MMKKVDMWFKKVETRMKKAEQDRKKVEQAMKEIYEKGVKDGSGKSDVNPFKIKKEDVFIDPNDPNRSIEDQKRLRRNWDHRKSYHRRKDKEKEKALAIEILAKAIEKSAKKKRSAKKKSEQEQVAQVEPTPKNY